MRKKILSNTRWRFGNALETYETEGLDLGEFYKQTL